LSKGKQFGTLVQGILPRCSSHILHFGNVSSTHQVCCPALKDCNLAPSVVQTFLQGVVLWPGNVVPLVEYLFSKCTVLSLKSKYCKSCSMYFYLASWLVVAGKLLKYQLFHGGKIREIYKSFRR
jgi:hypothetical protein